MKKRIIGIVLALVLVAISVPLATALAHETLPLDHVVISPANATVALGGMQQFTASGQDSHNTTLTRVTYTWAVVAGGGTINNKGLFTTGNATGTFINTIKVTATKNSIEKSANATVIIKANEKEDKDSDRPNGWSHGEKKGWHGEDTPPGWSHGKKTGWDDESQPNGLSKSKVDRDDD